jgi:hypothetical protein
MPPVEAPSTLTDSEKRDWKKLRHNLQKIVINIVYLLIKKGGNNYD